MCSTDISGRQWIDGRIFDYEAAQLRRRRYVHGSSRNKTAMDAPKPETTGRREFLGFTLPFRKNALRIK